MVPIYSHLLAQILKILPFFIFHLFSSPFFCLFIKNQICIPLCNYNNIFEWYQDPFFLIGIDNITQISSNNLYIFLWYILTMPAFVYWQTTLVQNWLLSFHHHRAHLKMKRYSIQKKFECKMSKKMFGLLFDYLFVWFIFSSSKVVF